MAKGLIKQCSLSWKQEISMQPSLLYCGIKPETITTVTAISKRRKKIWRWSDSDESDKSEEECDAFEEESDSFEEDDDPENSEMNESADDGNVNVSKKLCERLCLLFLTIHGSEIVGKW